MLSIIIQTTILYWTAGLDLLVILALLYMHYDRKRHRTIMFGQMLGSIGLVFVSLLLAVVFQVILPAWILGFLGLVPIYFAIKLIIKEDDEAEVEETFSKRRDKNLLVTVAFLSFASCGADNIGLFTPYLATVNPKYLWLVLVTFVVNIVILSILSDQLSHIPHLSERFEQYSRWIVVFVYFALSIFIFIETGVVAKLIGLF